MNLDLLDLKYILIYNAVRQNVQELPVFGGQCRHLMPLPELSDVVSNAPDVLQLPVVEVIHHRGCDFADLLESRYETVNLRLLLGGLGVDFGEDGGSVNRRQLGEDILH